MWSSGEGKASTSLEGEEADLADKEALVTTCIGTPRVLLL